MRWDWTRGRTVLVPDEDCSGAVEVDVVGGNHTLMIGRAAFEAVEPPRAELFFGFEEPEYCLRIRGAGLRILVDGDSMLDARRQGGVLGLTKRSEWTARNPEWRPVRPQRQYYSTRNYIYSMRRSFGRPDLARRELVRAVLRTVYAWRFGPRYAVSFDWHQLRGVIDGYRGHMGRRIVLG